MRELGLDETSYKKFLKIADMNKSIDTGIMIVPSFDYFEKLVPLYTNPWYKDVVKDVSYLLLIFITVFFLCSLDS